MNSFTEENQETTYEFLVNVFDAKGLRIEQKRFKTFQEAQDFMVSEGNKGYDTHLSRLIILTEGL